MVLALEPQRHQLVLVGLCLLVHQNRRLGEAVGLPPCAVWFGMGRQHAWCPAGAATEGLCQGGG